MKSLSLRGIELPLYKKIKETAKANGTSINQLIIDILKQHLGFKKDKKHTAEYHDLDHLFGRWSKQEYNNIQNKINSERKIDKELWK